jgi:hypothetical protein
MSDYSAGRLFPELQAACQFAFKAAVAAAKPGKRK